MTKQTTSSKKKEILEGKCGDCGETVKSNQKFCPGCGAELDWGEPEEKPVAKVIKQTEKTESPAAKTTSREERLDYLINDAKAKRTKWLIVGGVCFILVFIIVGTTPDGQEPSGIVGLFGLGVVLSIINLISISASLSKFLKEKNNKA